MPKKFSRAVLAENKKQIHVESRWVDAKMLCEKTTIQAAYYLDESNV